MLVRSDVPGDSAVSAMKAKADYRDAYDVVVKGEPPSALHACLALIARTPKWIDLLMSLRNAAARLLSLKDVGRLARLTVSTMVVYHHRIGRLYMLPVAPMHRIVVRSTLARIPSFAHP